MTEETDLTVGCRVQVFKGVLIWKTIRDGWMETEHRIPKGTRSSPIYTYGRVVWILGSKNLVILDIEPNEHIQACRIAVNKEACSRVVVPHSMKGDYNE